MTKIKVYKDDKVVDDDLTVGVVLDLIAEYSNDKNSDWYCYNSEVNRDDVTDTLDDICYDIIHNTKDNNVIIKKVNSVTMRLVTNYVVLDSISVDLQLTDYVLKNIMDNAPEHLVKDLKQADDKLKFINDNGLAQYGLTGHDMDKISQRVTYDYDTQDYDTIIDDVVDFDVVVDKIVK